MNKSEADKIKIAVLVSGGGTNLQALIDAQKSGSLSSGYISLVISDNSKAYALARAEAAGIQTAIFDRGMYKDRQSLEDDISRLLIKEKAELIILAGFMMILSEKFTKRFRDRIINVHPSLIPSFCGKGFYGLRVHEAALEYGVRVTGATVHFVNEIPDGGRIIMQKAVDIREGDTAPVLQKRVMQEAEHIILPAAAEKLCRELRENIIGCDK